MTKRIFQSICLVAAGVFTASAALFLFVLCDYFGGIQKKQLRAQTELAARAAAAEGVGLLDGLDDSEYRVTWIAPGGAVLFDSRLNADAMENHLEREEIARALAYGTGESSRYSSTLMERSLYSAKRLPDGSVIRLSVSRHTLLNLILGMSRAIGAVLALAAILSMVLASRLAKRIVRPLNSLDLDHPLSNEGYDELSPLLHRIDDQQRRIRAQEEQLAQKQREFDAVTENMAEGIVLLGAEGNVLSVNRAAKQIFGADSSSVGRHFPTVCGNTDVSGLLLEAEAGRRAEKIVDLPSGRFQLILNPVRKNGTLSGSVLLAMDAEEKEKTERLRREFTANVSHELKTPLQTIAGSAELLTNGVVREQNKPAFYARIHNEARRMIRLVEDIIRLSHLDEGAGELKREETDLLRIAEETVRSLKAEAEKTRVHVSTGGAPAVVNGVPQLLRSIVFNLCDNAVKYNRENGSVSVNVTKGKGSVVLRVADTGIGIPPEHRERVFERFYRVDKSRSRKLGGTGLGLAIVKHAAKIHGASVTLSSVENVGTTVTVAFPDAERR